MKLWEIKAQSLRLMFADYDMQFDYEEFADGIVYSNSNTREKLIRMEDSIRRAIDLYYNIVGDTASSKIMKLATEEVDGETKFINKIDLSQETELDYPTRVDLRLVDSRGNIAYSKDSIDYMYDRIKREIHFIHNDFVSYGDEIEFRVWYKIKRENIPIIVDELTFDLDTLHIDEEAQRVIPYYVKGELFEEDEANLAAEAKNYYIQVISNLKRKFSVNQTRVRTPKVFDKRN